jgi:4-diphosphocytidyl-2-C-methyl-D-erythritol kinase
MTPYIRFSSPAKLNLYLKVLGKRPDGFHNIVTLFQRISLCDHLAFRRNPGGNIHIRCDHPHVPCGPKNLVYKVAQKIKELYQIRDGLDISIKKNIPVAAGLAGGSSNAATTLLALNKLWGLKLSRGRMTEIGREIGSDVPFFLYDTSWALGMERGDNIRPLKLAAKIWQTVVVPRVKMYAGTVYQGLNSKLTKTGADVNILTHCLRRNDLNRAGELLFNDLEPVVLGLRPSLCLLGQRLNALRAKGVMVSGSGPAIFGLMADARQAQAARKILIKRYSQVFVTSTL